MAFRFRLAKVLEWYERRYTLEAGLLRDCAERAAKARHDLARHHESRLRDEQQAIHLEALAGGDLRARESWRAQALIDESLLLQSCQRAERALEAQRTVTLDAQRRVRLVEKLRDRKSSEFDYLAEKVLEEIAADSHLAGLTRQKAS